MQAPQAQTGYEVCHVAFCGSHQCPTTCDKATFHLAPRAGCLEQKIDYRKDRKREFAPESNRQSGKVANAYPSLSRPPKSNITRSEHGFAAFIGCSNELRLVSIALC